MDLSEKTVPLIFAVLPPVALFQNAIMFGIPSFHVQTHMCRGQVGVIESL